jgi:hypothetical protein
MEILNDFNYLRVKTQKDVDRSKSNFSDNFSSYSNPISNASIITG